jgi:ketosteroid isomerase-like protein
MNALTTPASGLIDSYVTALAADDADAALATLSADAVFQSPFNTWRSRHVPSVFRARTSAFSSLQVKSVVRGHDRAVIVWHATVDGAPVEGAELLSVRDGAICRVDVFLRPATVLDAVHQAMVAAWPSSLARSLAPVLDWTA